MSERDVRILAAIGRLPETFGLHGFPGDTFRVSAYSSYINDDDVVVLYTQRYVSGETDRDGEFVDFAKGTEAEIRAQMVVRQRHTDT